jgi:hypothetical protein
MLLFGVALVGIGRALARGEDEFLLRFLQTTLDAHELPLDR